MHTCYNFILINFDAVLLVCLIKLEFTLSARFHNGSRGKFSSLPGSVNSAHYQFKVVQIFFKPKSLSIKRCKSKANL